jgi:hypothetical protein
MPAERTRSILKILARDRDEKLAPAILKIFGASSLEECAATYEAVGKAERASLDEILERVIANASAAFLLSVENEASRAAE